jgi:predicted nucleotidyltransferase
LINQLQHHLADQVISITLFGSRARGEASSESDMDMLIVLTEMTPETRRLVYDLAADIWLESGIFLSTLVWSQAQWREAARLQTSLYRNISQEGIELFHVAPT